MEALSVVDTLLATRVTEDFQQRSIACTARPHSIDRAAELVALRENEPTPGVLADAPPPPPSANTTPSPPPQPDAESIEEQQRVVGRDNQSQQTVQNSRPRQPPRSNRPVERTAERRQESHQESAQPRPRQRQRQQQQQPRCTQCKRRGHTRSQCTRKSVCDYCNGRFHSSENCKVKRADQRQQELVLAVR